MPICALVGATYFNEEHFLAQHFDCVIAVDRGYESLCSLGVVPDLVVGDFDSLGFIPEGDNVLRFPIEKDESDMEIAIRGADHGGCDIQLFYGALGRRLDHTIANLQLMVGRARRGLHVAAIGADSVVVALDGKGVNSLEFASFNPDVLAEGEYGRYISVFAQGGVASGVNISGLKYGLVDADLSDEKSLGLSNEFIGEPAHISVEMGALLVILPIDAWRYLKKW